MRGTPENIMHQALAIAAQSRKYSGIEQGSQKYILSLTQMLLSTTENKYIYTFIAQRYSDFPFFPFFLFIFFLLKNRSVINIIYFFVDNGNKTTLN